MLKDPNDYFNQTSALADCCQAIELSPNNPFHFQNRAFILTKLHRYNEALADYVKAIYLRPKNAYCHYKAASLLKKMNHHREAIRHYKLILFKLLGKFAEDQETFEKNLGERFQSEQEIATFLKTQVKSRIPKPSLGIK